MPVLTGKAAGGAKELSANEPNNITLLKDQTVLCYQRLAVL